MIMKKSMLINISILLLSMTSVSTAETFWRSGSIDRVTTDGQFYGGCMIHIVGDISNGCPSGGWVSLDCTNTYFNNGNQKLAQALTGYSLKNFVSLLIDNTKKHDGYCVAQRIDLNG